MSVGDLTGLTTGNTAAFGVLSNGTSANALGSTITFTAANSYKQSYTGLNLAGLTGANTVLNPTSGAVLINGPVNNQESGTVTGHSDTLTVQGTTTGNQITGIISDASGFTSVGNGDTRVTSNGSGQWILSGANTYHGPTTFNATAGSLEFAGNSALPGATSIIGSGGAGAGFAPTTTTPWLQIRADGTGNGSTLALGNNITIMSSQGTTGMGIDVGSLNGSTSNVTVSFGTLANNTPAALPNLGGFFFTGNNNYIAQMAVFALAGSSGATNYMSASGNMNVQIGSPLALSASAVYSQDTAVGTGFDTVGFNGTTGAGTNGLGNVIYGRITDGAGYVPFEGLLEGETNVMINSVYNGIQSATPSSGSTSLWTLSGSETFHGYTIVNGGTLQLGTGQPGQNGYLYGAGILLNSSSAPRYGNPLLVDNGWVVYNNADPQTIFYNMASLTSGTLAKSGPGILSLTSTDNLNALVINGGTLQVSMGSMGQAISGFGITAGSIATTAPIIDNAALVYALTAATPLPNTFTGSGAFYQNGTGSVTMSSIAGFTGIFGVNAGSLILNGATKATSMTAAGATTLSGTLSAPQRGGIDGQRRHARRRQRRDGKRHLQQSGFYQRRHH